MESILNCKTLLGKKNLDFSIECLTTFVQNSSSKINLIVFDDGSLTPDDKVLLQSVFIDISIVDKKCRDILLNDLLEKFPNCKRYRDSTIYAHKLFDMMLYDNTDLFYIDSDIYFLNKFTLPAFNTTPFFMLDMQNAYSFTPFEFNRFKKPIFPKINSGIFFFPQSKFSLDFVEELLNNKIILQSLARGIPWLEQTLWSLIAANNNSVCYFDPQQVAMAEEKMILHNQLICVHLVSTYRYHFKQVKLFSETIEKDNDIYQDVNFYQSDSFLTKKEYFLERLVNKLKRYL